MNRMADSFGRVTEQIIPQKIRFVTTGINDLEKWMGKVIQNKTTKKNSDEFRDLQNTHIWTSKSSFSPKAN